MKWVSDISINQLSSIWTLSSSSHSRSPASSCLSTQLASFIGQSFRPSISVWWSLAIKWFTSHSHRSSGRHSWLTWRPIPLKRVSRRSSRNSSPLTTATAAANLPSSNELSQNYSVYIFCKYFSNRIFTLKINICATQILRLLGLIKNETFLWCKWKYSIFLSNLFLAKEKHEIKKIVLEMTSKMTSLLIGVIFGTNLWNNVSPCTAESDVSCRS